MAYHWWVAVAGRRDGGLLWERLNSSIAQEEPGVGWEI